MTRPRVAFLPAFFTALAIVFGVALWLRIRSYRDEVPAAAARDQVGQSAVVGTQTQVTIPREPQGSDAPSMAVTEPRSRRKAGMPDLTPLLTAPRPVVAPVGAKAAKVAPVAAPVAAKPSLFSRLVNAITGGSKGPSPSQSTQLQTSSGRSSATGTSGTATATDPNDPNSDTQPPQLISVAFVPPQIHDGEETVLTIHATDNLSGVRSVSGTIVAPSGAVQGFACQRQPETDAYVAHIAVPKDAAEGVWRINYLNLIDNASNAASISSAQGALPPTASFRVISSSSDSQGPTLKAVWLDRPAIRAGEKDTVFVSAEDDKSGVNLVSGVFISPSKHARIGFVCRPGTSGTWEGELTIPGCIDCGDWQLEQVQLQDKANNMTTARSDNAAVASVRVNITSDRCDANAPEIHSILLSPNVVSNAQDTVIGVTAIASDDMCGIMSMSGQVSGPTTSAGAPRLYFSFTPGGDGQTWIGRLSVPKLAAKGSWRVSWIQVLDQAHNLKTYSQGDPALANAVFNVQ